MRWCLGYLSPAQLDTSLNVGQSPRKSRFCISERLHSRYLAIKPNEEETWADVRAWADWQAGSPLDNATRWPFELRFAALTVWSSPRSMTENKVLPAELAIIIPTRNERENIVPLLGRLDVVLAGIAWEVVFVDDDSTDGTAGLVQEIARHDPRVRCLKRIGRRGLSSACIEGWAATAAPFLAVMDADLQHDESLLPSLLERLHGGEYDVAIGSRYVAGGGLGAWGVGRRWVSRIGTVAGHRLLRVSVSDPMSGFFMLRRQVFEEVAPRLTGVGFKILLDLLASTERPLRVVELPFTFRLRAAGESKLDTLVVLEFVQLVVHKLARGLVPVRFAFGVLVGVVGVSVHLLTLRLGLQFLASEFWQAQSLATAVAMLGDYLLNNSITHRDWRHRGAWLVAGALGFMSACAMGALANVCVAVFAFAHGFPWWLAGLSGAVVGVVWNNTVSAQLVWRRA